MKKGLLCVVALSSITLTATAGIEYQKEGLVDGKWVNQAGGSCTPGVHKLRGKWQYQRYAGETQFAGPGGSGSTYDASITPHYLMNQVCDSKEAVKAMLEGKMRW